jgi:hypothetical protein
MALEIEFKGKSLSSNPLDSWLVFRHSSGAMSAFEWGDVSIRVGRCQHSSGMMGLRSRDMHMHIPRWETRQMGNSPDGKLARWETRQMGNSPDGKLARWETPQMGDSPDGRLPGWETPRMETPRMETLAPYKPPTHSNSSTVFVVSLVISLVVRLILPLVVR